MVQPVELSADGGRGALPTTEGELRHLPAEWLARYNKQIFGPMYVAGVVFLVVRWASATA